MYGKKQTEPCPMCTSWLDGVNGTAHHLAQNIDFAVVTAADVPRLHSWAKERSWDKIRVLSAEENTFKSYLGSKAPTESKIR